MSKINNVCYCECHKRGLARCVRCKFLHQSKEKPATHPNDKSNPNFKMSKKEYEDMVELNDPQLVSG